jgi:hypothetical protein
MKSLITKTSFFFIILIIITLLPISVLSADLVGQIEKAKKNMINELATPFSKVGLQSIVYNFYKARISLAPNQYENQNEFKQTFMGTFQIFGKLLWEGDLKAISGEITNNDVTTMYGYYPANEERFWGFIEKLKLQDDKFITLRIAGPELILRSQIYFSLILIGGDRTAYNNALKWTPGFPFCKLPKN